MAVSFLTNMSEQRSQNQRLDAIEKELAVVKAEQRINSDYRVQHQQQWEDFQRQYKIDLGSLLDGQRIILHDIRVHAGAENLNKPLPH